MIQINFTQFVGTGKNLLSEPSGVAQLSHQDGRFTIVNDTNPQKALFVASMGDSGKLHSQKLDFPDSPELLQRVETLEQKRKPTDPDKTFVFCFRGRRIKRINNTGWKQGRDMAGLKGIRVHDLRRTWASWHLQAGTTIDELMKIGGWASPEIVRI